MAKGSIVVLCGSADQMACRAIQKLTEAGYIPTAVFIGSRWERVRYKWKALRRIRRLHGFSEVVVGFLQRRKNPVAVEAAPAPSLQVLSQKGFAVRRYPLLNGPQLVAEIKALRPDIICFAGCGIIGSEILNIPRFGCINAHPAVLPGIRGNDPLYWSILKKAPFGVTAHLATKQVDAGDLLICERLTPKAGESLTSFRGRMRELQSDLLARATIGLLEGTITPQKQTDLSDEVFYSTNVEQKRLAMEIFEAQFRI